jgi:hypothetical protein
VAPMEEPRSPLAHEAHALIHRAVQAITEAKHHGVRPYDPMGPSRERVVWSDSLIGDSLVIRDHLREAVAAIAGLERAKGAPPEKVLKLLKELVEADVDQLDLGDARSLTDDIVRWGIEAYYAA